MSMSKPTDIVHERRGPSMEGIDSWCYFWYEPRILRWYIEAHAGTDLCQTETMDRRPTEAELNAIMHNLVTHAVWREVNGLELC